MVDDGEDIPEKTAEGKAVGIDLGLTHFAITSDGSKFDNPRWLARHEKNLRKKQKRLSRRLQDSNNRNKARKQVAGVHNKISRCRSDFHHKLSRFDSRRKPSHSGRKSSRKKHGQESLPSQSN
ncbi:transposase [Phormidium pseudopriestleyi FRX01]|uniref:Transposase n=1 Tax=Phormidium pseudopriestleyi FRX01 TaxID=1759528 RepID=A0ABS3FNK7_9CYAN|nr:transposase [Phormidium pseudopriestleyi FRX01]